MNQYYNPQTGELQKIVGGMEHLDAAAIWARALFHSALGSEAGEAAFRQIPAQILLMAYSEALAQPTYH